VVITGGRFKGETGLVVRGANGYYSVRMHRSIKELSGAADNTAMKRSSELAPIAPNGKRLVLPLPPAQRKQMKVEAAAAARAMGAQQTRSPSLMSTASGSAAASGGGGGSGGSGLGKRKSTFATPSRRAAIHRRRDADFVQAGEAGYDDDESPQHQQQRSDNEQDEEEEEENRSSPELESASEGDYSSDGGRGRQQRGRSRSRGAQRRRYQRSTSSSGRSRSSSCSSASSSSSSPRSRASSGSAGIGGGDDMGSPMGTELLTPRGGSQLVGSSSPGLGGFSLAPTTPVVVSRHGSVPHSPLYGASGHGLVAPMHLGPAHEAKYGSGSGSKSASMRAPSPGIKQAACILWALSHEVPMDEIPAEHAYSPASASASPTKPSHLFHPSSSTSYALTPFKSEPVDTAQFQGVLHSGVSDVLRSRSFLRT
jgi:hypothetical protein